MPAGVKRLGVVGRDPWLHPGLTRPVAGAGTSWFRLTDQPQTVIDVLTATFDCDRAVKVDGFLVCPRRA